MQLILEDGTTWHFPNPSAIRNGLAQVNGEDNSFIVLEASEMTYMQAVGSVADGFTVEYQDGDISHHYQAQTVCSFEQTAILFEQYADGDTAWLNAVGWQLIKI